MKEELLDVLNELRSLLFSREGSVWIKWQPFSEKRGKETKLINLIDQLQEYIQTLLKPKVNDREHTVETHNDATASSRAASRPEPTTTTSPYTPGQKDVAEETGSSPGKSKEKAARQRAAGAAQRTRRPDEGGARPCAPRLPASARLCAAPGSPRARRSCRRSRTQRVSCRCGTCARAPRAHAAWRTPAADEAGEKAAERGPGARASAGRGAGAQAREPHLAALDALVGAAAQKQAGAQQLRFHLDAGALVRAEGLSFVQRRAHRLLRGCGGTSRSGLRRRGGGRLAGSAVGPPRPPALVGRSLLQATTLPSQTAQVSVCLRYGGLDSGIPALLKQSSLVSKTKCRRCCRLRRLIFSLSPTGSARTNVRDEQPPPRIQAADPSSRPSQSRRSRKPPHWVPHPTNKLPPPGKTLLHLFSLSVTKAAQLHSSLRGPCRLGPRAPNGSLPGDTEGDGGLQKSSNSELGSQTLSSQLPGDAEALSGASVSCASGDKRPRGSAFAPPALEVLSAGRRQDGGSGQAWLGPMVLKWLPQTVASGRPPLSPDLSGNPPSREGAGRPWHLGGKPGTTRTD
nr:PREDICTED: uncharacterized protein LOC103555709 [Equus przewalskii]